MDHREKCPNCGTYIGPPLMAHGMMGQNMRSKRECVQCGTALLWFTTGDLANEWLVDDEAEMQKRLDAEGPRSG